MVFTKSNYDIDVLKGLIHRTQDGEKLSPLTDRSGLKRLHLTNLHCLEFKSDMLPAVDAGVTYIVSKYKDLDIAKKT